MEGMTMLRSAPESEGSGLLAVFRSQAREARIALVLSWLVFASMVLRGLIGLPPEEALSRYVMAVLVEAPGLALLMRSQIVACRGGQPLRLPWVPPVIILLALVPLALGQTPLAVNYAFAVVILTYRPKVAFLTCAALAAYVLAMFPTSPGITSVGVVLEIAMTVTIIVAVTVLAVWVDRLHLTREVLARRRVDAERERIARDLHDLMGRTLVAASLRNQASVQMLGPGEPELAAKLDRLHETLAAGQVQLRALTSGPVVSSLDGELATARTLCDRVSIDLSVQRDGDVPGPLDSLLGSIVRENITNVLKHSRASRCHMEIRADEHAATVRITSDGAAAVDWDGAYGESRVARAVAAAGGESSGVFSAEGDHFEFTARIPINASLRSAVLR